ncbi:hypothetical protein [Streptomyces sp. NPDC059165]|uniref:hypothetical protein n=1 Tax=Streptomyces sp. NPDC059165 TaxID=3346751 RepID=UPI0036C2A2E2
MTGQRRSARASACLTALVAVALAAGGATGAQADDDITSLTARQIADEAREALLDARSVHISSTGDLRHPHAPDELDLSLDRAGNCAGTVSMGSKGSVEIIKRGETVWLKPDAAFWKSQVPGNGEEAHKLFGDRYLRGSTNDSVLEGLADVCDLDTFLDRLTGAEDTQVPLTKGAKTEVDGTPAIPVTGKHAGRTLTLYVATEGKHYPVRLVVTSAGAAKATVDFTDYDEPVPTATPPASDTVDLSTVMDLVG